jgi:hypothetical protein
MPDIFLTAYDPSDLPGGSVDPLGFERGYLLLADKILPGLTNVAERPRYFALLCAGIYLNQDDESLPPRELTRQRQETLLRMERFWALANVLAADADSGGVRGVSYARDKAAEITRASQNRVDARYQLLSRQLQYGAIGMYGSVADGLRYLNRDTFTLTADLGEVAAEAFLEETGIPSVLKNAIREDKDVGFSTLRDWGERAHVQADVGPIESKCLYDALHTNPVRSRMAALLKRHPAKTGETELDRLNRIARNINPKEENQDLSEALNCILAYEQCYRLVLLSLERLLWLCRQTDCSAKVSLEGLKDDPVVRLVTGALPGAVGNLTRALDGGETEEFRRDLDRLQPTRQFLESAATKADDTKDFILELMSRHADVQRGKFDRGRRKMPWLEMCEERIGLTMTRTGGLNFEAVEAGQINPHPYRLTAADAMIAAAAKGGSQ